MFGGGSRNPNLRSKHNTSFLFGFWILETSVIWKSVLFGNQCYLDFGNQCYSDFGNQCYSETSVIWKPVLFGLSVRMELVSYSQGKTVM